MKSFIAIVMFVMVPFVFADDVVWQSGPQVSLAPYAYPHEVVPVPGGKISSNTEGQVHAQSSQQNPQGAQVPPPPQPSTDQRGDQRGTYNEKEEEKLQLLREANSIQQQVIAGGKTAAGWQRGITALQILLAAIALVYSAKSVGIANRSLRVANRAYLAIRWPESRNTTYSDEGGNKTIRVAVNKVLKSTIFEAHCSVINAGLTPARLLAQCCDCYLCEQAPTPIHRSQSLDSPLALPSLVAKQILGISALLSSVIGDEEYAKMQDGTLTLYVVACVDYVDVFGEEQRVASWMSYDVGLQKLVMFNKPGYNYST